MDSKIIVLGNNGEVMKEFDGSSHSIRSKSQDIAYKRLKEQELNKDNKKFIVSYQNSIEGLFEYMTLTERGMLFKLVMFLEFGSEGKLVKQGKALKQTDLENIIGKGKKATREFISKLELLSVIFSEKNGRTKEFFLNDTIHSLGEKVKGEFYTKLYVIKGRELVDELNHEELGVLWSILPFFHFESFMLCKNSNEMNPAKYEFMSVGELAEQVGVNEDTLSPKIKTLRKKGVLMELRTGNRKTFKVNPSIMYRKKEWTSQAQEVTKEFETLLEGE